jgi:tetratricopeptide (TPR) repeat protein
MPEAEPTAEQPPVDPKVKEAVAIFDEGRQLFQNGDFAGAQAKVDKAIGVLPEDRVLHEFRALTLFAQQKYPEAAATLYAVLAAGPGWNWETIKTFYPDKEIYTKQLRALESYVREHPTSADARFVQGYHYLMLGHNDAAVKALQKVTELVPQDQLSAQLVKALSQPAATTPEQTPTTTG